MRNWSQRCRDSDYNAAPRSRKQARTRSPLSSPGHTPARIDSAAANPADLDRADRIRVFMRDRHTEQPRLEDLAAVLHLSESRAGHLVRELTGRGFGALLTEARLQTATALLRNTALSIGQVALQSGFGDLGHFHRLFRRRMGQTPRGYRRLSEHGRQKS